MIEVIEKLKWKDEVLVKIPLLTCSDGYLVKKIGESDIKSEYLKEFMSKSNSTNMKYGNIHLIYHKLLEALLVKDLNEVDIELLVRYIENRNKWNKWVGTVISISLEMDLNKHVYVSIPESTLNLLDLSKDYSVFMININHGIGRCETVAAFGLVENFKMFKFINKEDVLTVLDRGYKVGRTDWDTFWLQKVGTEIKIMNKDDRVLNPHEVSFTSIFDEISETYRYYAFIDNKECVRRYAVPAYNIAQAIVLLKLGNCMKRKAWGSDVYIKGVSKSYFTIKQILSRSNEERNYYFTIDDIYATDWVIYKKGDE